MNRMTVQHLTVLALFGAALALRPGLAGAVTVDWGVKLKAAALTEDAPDPDAPSSDESTEAYLDVQPQLHTQFTPDFSHFIRLQAFLPSGRVTSNEQEDPEVVETYGALREFWFEFGGITSYPGEVLRLGLQRLRDPDGLWYDRDIESVRWIFDTTLFQFQAGAAKQYQIYRTDDSELSESQKDRAYGFLGVSTQWVPRNFIGARLAYATDQKELPPAGTTLETDGGSTLDPISGVTFDTYREPEVRDYGWVGVFLDNDFYDWERAPGLAYRLEIMGLRGQAERVDVVDPAPDSPGTPGQTGAVQSRDVDAVGADAGLRVRFPGAFPLQVGGGYAYGEGGEDDNGSHNFRQTGLQSNRSRFTGTRTIVNRFNEALRADLTNLRAIAAYVSLPLADWDFSLVAHRFERDDPTQRVYTDGVDIDPVNKTSTDLGNAWDAVVTWHFKGQVTGYSLEDDRRSNLRLRAAEFTPGDAYGPNADKQRRVLLEGTLWF